MSLPIPQIFTPNLDILQNKLRLVLSQGPSKFKIISDFDSTLSSPKSLNSWTTIERNPNLRPEYVVKTKQLCDHYHPIEIDPELSYEEKCYHMEMYRNTAEKYIIEERINREMYHSILLYAQENMILRDYVHDLFTTSHHLQIPLLVFSAGIGDVIDSVLIHHFSHCYLPVNPYYPILSSPTTSTTISQQQAKEETSLLPVFDHTICDNMIPHAPTSPVEYGAIQGIPRTIYILANHLDFASGGEESSINTVHRDDPSTYKPTDIISGFHPDFTIHVFNKHEELVKNAPYYQTAILPRTNVILLGDSLGDALMAHRDSPDNVIRLAFLATTPQKKTIQTHLQKYLDAFDIVFVDSDLGIKWCNDILAFFDLHQQYYNNHHNNTTKGSSDDGAFQEAIEKTITKLISDVVIGMPQ